MEAIRRLLLVCLIGALQACGGGGSGAGEPDSSTGGGGGQQPPPANVNGDWTVRLSWQDSSEPRLAGYRVYHGLSSAANDEHFEAGLATSFSFSTRTGGSHYFSLAAIDLSGTESPRSAAVRIDLK